MRIALVPPVFESVPPKRYGGIERMVSYLTEELVAAGQDVTLFATGDSVTRAELVCCAPQSVREYPQWVDPIAFHALQLKQVLDREFDVVHFNIEYLAFPFARCRRLRALSTLHGPLMDCPALFEAFHDFPLVSISDAQRAPFPRLNWRATVQHGLPDGLYRCHPEAGRYLAFLGRIAPEKGCDRAIEIAARAGLPLKIAAKIDPYDHAYYDAEIKPLLAREGVEFVGEISEREKNDFLGNALALLFPIDWPEPFGLVMIEALACGTPVVAFNRGSVPEVIEDGETGFIVEDVAGAVRACAALDRFSRPRCRAAFDRRFTAARMAADYLSVYRALG